MQESHLESLASMAASAKALLDIFDKITLGSQECSSPNSERKKSNNVTDITETEISRASVSSYTSDRKSPCPEPLLTPKFATKPNQIEPL
jgi:cobalamin biosynthesis protein CobT